ncbi:MAG TPA: DUF5683 domain-containing protein [Brumimicrobium sp.]|nr:DUF5683 domain-containing protein [Brumimicrobium sp.]
MRILFLLLLLITCVSFAQENEQQNGIINDTLIEKKAKDTLHSPKKAALFSLIPGGGQIYNHLAMPKGKKKAFWKVPIIYAGLGVTGYYAIQNHISQKALKEEYLFRSNNGYANLAEYAEYDNQGVLTLFETKRTNRDLMIFAFIIVYGLNILDAHVEAHFVNFDVSKDLSLRIQPRLHDFRTPGISFSFNFR